MERYKIYYREGRVLFFPLNVAAWGRVAHLCIHKNNVTYNLTHSLYEFK